MCSAVGDHGMDPCDPATTCTENNNMAKRPSTTHSKDINQRAAKAAVMALHGILPKNAPAEVKRIAKVAFSMGFASGFDAGFESATRTDTNLAGAGQPTGTRQVPTDPEALLATFRITKRTGRTNGGNWVSGTNPSCTRKTVITVECI